MSTILLSDGALYKDIDGLPIIRERYSWHYAMIDTPRKLAASLRAGPYLWPGGYDIALVTSDSAMLCFNCGKNEYYNIVDSMRRGINDGWRVVGSMQVFEPCFCDHCNKELGAEE